MSVPARICTKRSAVAEVRVNRGSTEISLALRFRFASIAHLKPQGWFSAGFPPMINIMSVFLMSTQPLVIAPRPNVGPKLGAVSNPRLVFQVADPQAAHGLDDQVIELVGIGAAAGPGHALAAVDGAALRVFLHEGVVTRLLHPVRDLIEGMVPGNVFPVIRTRTADLRFEQAAWVQDVLFQ